MDTSTCPEGVASAGPGEPAVVGEYDLIRVLGQGGMGIVYEARHLRSGHSVAIKILDRSLCVHPELVERFHREAEASRALTSHRTVRVYDLGTTDDGAPYIVMELLEGRDLARVAAGGPVAIEDAVRWILQACEGVAEAHEHAIVHRDLKPGNLLLGAGGIKVLDFGIAKHRTARAAITLGTTAPLGTPEYMSPEQVLQPSEVDPRADVWSLGITLYELLTGRTPFCHENPVLCMRAILDDAPEDPRHLRPELDPALCAVVLRALAKDPKKRYQSVDAFGEALAHVTQETWSRAERRSHHPVFARTGAAASAPRARRAGRAGRPASRARGLLLTAGFATLAALFAAHWTHAASATEAATAEAVTAHATRIGPRVKTATAAARSNARLTTIRSRGLVATGR